MLYRSLSQWRWKLITQPWQEIDGFLLLLLLALMSIGGFMIHSTQINGGESTYWWQQLVIGIVGMAIALFIAQCRYESLLRWRWPIYGLTNLALLAVMLLGTEALGAQRWISVGGFNIQPSEFAKLGLIITLAGMLHQQTASTIPAVVKAMVVTSLPWALVFLQPDLGTSLVFGAIVLVMLYWANANPGWLILLVSPLISAILFNIYLPLWFFWVGGMVAIAWNTLPWRWYGMVSAAVVNLVSGKLGEVFWGLLKDYQKDRLILFLDPTKDPLGGGYHLIQSRIAIGAGELWGRGLHQGTQTQLNFIPEQHTDFIFSAIGEELGFFGAIVVIAIYWLICLRLIIIAQNAKDNFGSLIAVGVLAMIVFQVLVNIGMTIGLAPITGIPLPWLSYGRSAILSNFMAVGLVEAIMNHRHRLRF
ncbi:MAG: rod shape-determining protein RodA [Cyanobacteria bacterium P01_E01_bin.6]